MRNQQSNRWQWLVTCAGLIEDIAGVAEFKAREQKRVWQIQ